MPQVIDKLFVATKAFIEHEGKILVLRESAAYQDGTNVGKFDIVGGRLNPGEHFRDALLREVKEETGLSVTMGRPFFVNEWRPVVRGEQWQVVATFFVAHAASASVVIGEDHAECKWIDPKHYKAEGLIENLYPAFEAYLELENTRHPCTPPLTPPSKGGEFRSGRSGFPLLTKEG